MFSKATKHWQNKYNYSKSIYYFWNYNASWQIWSRNNITISQSRKSNEAKMCKWNYLWNTITNNIFAKWTCIQKIYIKINYCKKYYPVKQDIQMLKTALTTGALLALTCAISSNENIIK